MLTKDKEKAQLKYNEISSIISSEIKRLVDLVEVPDEFDGDHVFYWGQPNDGTTVLCTNNN